MRKARLLTIISVVTMCVLALAAVAAYAEINDTTPPTTTSGALAVYMGDATIKFTARDDAEGRGVAYMYYRVDKHSAHMYRVDTMASHSITIEAPKTGSKTHTVRYWSQDKSGNVEKVNSMTVIVKPAPAMVACHFTPLEGGDRYLTAIEASKAGFDSAGTVVVARGDVFADALGGSALAGAVDGPLLLTKQDAVPQPVLDEIKRLGATKIYVLGGESAISAGAFEQLKAVAGSAERLGGDNRYATAALVANKTISLLGSSYGGSIFLATGLNFPDALGASPIAYAKGIPIVLVDSAGNFTVPAGATKAHILGGTNVVPASVETALGGRFDERLAGDDRYATSAAVAEFGVSQGLSWDGVGIATGASPADALSGGAMLGSKNAVMLLTMKESLASDAAAKLQANKADITQVYYLGGLNAVSQATRTACENIFKVQ